MSDKVWIKLRGGEGWGCPCMKATLPLIEDEMLRLGLIKRCLDVFQWAHNPGKVSKSAGTHDLGGVIDVGQFSLAQRKVWARFGVMMFPRTSLLGWLTGNHGHGVWHGCPHQVPYTAWQVRSGLAGGDGLGSSATLKGKRWRNFEAPKRTWQDALKVETAAAGAAKAAAGKAKAQVKAPAKVTTTKSGIYAMGQGRPISLKATMRNMGKPNGNVKILQTILQAQKYNGTPLYGGPLDGIYGPATKAAVKKYQQLAFKTTNPKVADGILGWSSFSKLASWAGWRPIK